MEIESLYSAEDEKEIGTLKTQGLRADLDKHCTAICLADSLDKLRTVHLTEAYQWLNELTFAPGCFDHDYARIQAILGRAAERRMVALILKSTGNGGEKNRVTV